jgi:DNA polymerase V
VKFALCDCNNFYASCERVFRPDLRDRPVVVLSNNDGCIIARSAEVKAMGIKMGAPYFKERYRLESAGAAVFSSNYALYGDMSRRVMETLGTMVPDVEIYSVDEAFLLLDSAPLRGSTAEELCRHVKKQVFRWTGIPVSLGLGATKTLAKAANRIAKKESSCGGVFAIPEGVGADVFLAGLNVEDVWGVGFRYAPMLKRSGIRTALDLKMADDEWIRRRMTVCGLRTVWELRGTVCHPFRACPDPAKSIRSSRSFGEPVISLHHLREAVASFAERACETLRSQCSTAGCISVFIATSPHREDPQYANAATRRLAMDSDFTPAIITAAMECLEEIYVPGLQYVKAGVLLRELRSALTRQSGLFDVAETGRRVRLMAAIDRINGDLGRGRISVAASGRWKPRVWDMKQDLVSFCYTTRWEDLAGVRVVGGEVPPCRN